MRVALVCPYSLSMPGGVQSQVLGLGRSLRSMGVAAQVLAPCDGPPPDAAVIPLGRSLPTASNGSVAPIAPDLSCSLRVIRALRHEQFDVVHLHEPLCPGPTLTSLIFTDAPLVGTFHRAGRSGLYDSLRPAARWAAGHLDVRVAVSADALATAAEVMPGDYDLLFNGIEIDRFAKATPWPTDHRPTIAFLGRHEERKGLAVLLEAVTRLPAAMADVRVWVMGSGPQTDELMAKTAPDPRVEWLGRVDDAEAAARLRGADVACFPSLRGESFGVVLLEAMAAQTALVASDLPGYRNVARDGIDALLVAPGDADALAAGLARALTDRSLAARLVAAGEERAASFSMDRLAEEYLARYQRIVSQRIVNQHR